MREYNTPGLIIDPDKCIGCKKCLKSCAQNGIEIKDKKAIPTDSCILCGICADSCPVGAITLQTGSGSAGSEAADHSEDLWIFARTSENKVLPVAYELLGKGRELADQKGCRLVAVMGSGPTTPMSEIDALVAHGADEVIYCLDERLAESHTDMYTEWLCRLIHERRPEILLFGATGFGRELAPGVAVQMRTGLTADCTVLEIDTENGLLRQTRPAFGGNLMATITCPDRRPQMATVRAGVLKAHEPNPSRLQAPHILRTETALDASDTPVVRILEKIVQDNSDSIAKAEIILDVGRGIGSKKNLPLMKHLADLLHAKLGCSRPLVEGGWCEYKHQVGQTGSAVAPRLLICMGISGAIQHLAGIGGAETIIAVNSDPDAPIFGVANYAIVGDCIEVAREMIRQLEA